jgi:hypothetical protein
VKYDWLFPEEAARSGSAMARARERLKVSFRIVFSLQLLASEVRRLCHRIVEYSRCLFNELAAMSRSVRAGPLLV